MASIYPEADSTKPMNTFLVECGGWPGGWGEGLTGGNKLDMETLVHSFLDINVICSEPRYKHEISISNLDFNCATATMISTRCMVTPVVYNGYPLCFGGRLSVVMLWCFLSLKEL